MDKAVRPGRFEPVLPHHAESVQPGDLAFGQRAGGPPAAHPALGHNPAAQRQPLRRNVAFGDQQVAVLGLVQRRGPVILLPAAGQAVLQLFEQAAAVLRLLDDFKSVRYDGFALARVIQALDGGLYLLLQKADAAKPLDVVDHIDNDRRTALARGQGAADLLLVDDGRDGRAEEDHARNAGDVYALVEHIDAEQQAQMIGIVRLEAGKRRAGGGVVRVGFVQVRLRIHAREPGRSLGHHLVHMVKVGAKDQVFAFGQVFGKHFVQPVRLFQRTAQRFEIFIVRGLQAGRAQVGHALLIAGQVPAVAEHGGNIFRRRQNPPDDRFAQGHFAGDIAVEQFVGHVALVIEIADVGGRKAQQFDPLAGGQQLLQRGGPFLRAGAVVFVQDDICRAQVRDGGQVLFGQAQQLGVGVKMDVGQADFGGLAAQALALGGKDVFAG